MGPPATESPSRPRRPSCAGPRARRSAHRLGRDTPRPPVRCDRRRPRSRCRAPSTPARGARSALLLNERSVYAAATDERNRHRAVDMRQRRRPSEVRRSQILEAAVAVIAERGLCDSRISDVARRAKASPALVVYYFGTKERLLADALTFAEDRFYGQTSRELEPIPDARGRLV